ncbi:MAG TPA: hypothetical protein VNS62_01850 [Candidatus Udaeobacter sp.]|nr:hypothetical protein [Candidatus Udaeobacter sp.]
MGVGAGAVGVGVSALLVGGGTLCAPSPPALVVIGVGGPIGFVGGVMFGLAGGVLVFGAGGAAVGGAFGTVVRAAGAVVVAGGAGGGTAGAAVRCAATQVAQLRIVISGISRFAMGFSSIEPNHSLNAKL